MPTKTVNPRYLHFHPTLAASGGTRVTGTASLDCGPFVELVELRVVIPNGHAGLTGLQILYSGTVILPWSSPSGFLVGNSSDWVFDTGGLELDVPLVASMYNDDALTHGWDITVKVRDGGQPAGGIGAPIMAAVL